MKKMTFALACASTLALFATDFSVATFEGEGVLGKTVGGVGDDGTINTPVYWQYKAASGSTDGSAVKNYVAEGKDKPAAAPKGSGAVGDNYLDLSTEGGTLWRSFNAEAADLGEAKAVPADTGKGEGLFIDTMVQFTATEDGQAPETAEGDKLAIWLAKDGETAKLMVKGSKLDANLDTEETSSEVVSYELSNSKVTITDGAWYRLTVRAVQNVLNANAPSEYVPAFQIYIDGELMAVTGASVATADFLTFYSEDQAASLPDCLGANKALLVAGTLIPSMAGYSGVDNSALQAVGFKGSGAIDDLKLTDENPLPKEAPEVNFTVTPPADATEIMYAIGDGAAVALPADGKIGGAPGATVTITGKLADGTSFTKTGTISEDGTLDLSAVDWSFYLAADAEAANTYVIDSASEFTDFRKGVAAGLATAGVTFKQTADISLDGIVWPGIGTPKSNAAAAGFLGIYDGQNHLIENVTFERKQYIGLFANVGGNAQIKNLVIKVAGIAAEGGTSSYGAAACVGYAWGTGVLVENVTAAGQTAGTVLEGNHNIAGIGCRLQGTITLRNCTNNLALATTYSKIGGICAIASSDPAGLTETEVFKPAGAIVFEGCVNNASITAKGPLVDKPARTAGSDGIAGILAYIQSGKPISLVNCENNGTLQHTGDNGTNTGAADLPAIASFIGKSSGYTAVEISGNKATAGYLSMASGTVPDGLRYATVEGDVATFVADSAAVAGADLKVMAAGGEVALANVGDTITLDTALATATVTTTAEDAYVAQAGNVYTVTAKADAAFTVTVDPAEAEWTAELTLPTPTITGTTATGSWSPAAIVEPDAGTTNVYTYTVTVAATDTTKETTKSVEFKVYKNATVVYPEYIGEDAEKQAKYETWAKANNIEDFADTAKANEAAYLLNVAPAEAEAEAGKFKITSITVDAEGNVTVVAPAKNSKGADFNGTVEVKGSATVDAVKYTLEVGDSAARFYKAILK